MALNAHARQPVSDIPRVNVERHQSGPDALPVGTRRATHTRPIEPGRPFTDAQVALAFDAHRRPRGFHGETFRCAVVYAARNEPDRIPIPWMRNLIEDERVKVAEYLNEKYGLLDVDCHACHRAVFVKPDDPLCPSCRHLHSTSEQQLLARAIDTLRVSGLVRS